MLHFFMVICHIIKETVVSENQMCNFKATKKLRYYEIGHLKEIEYIVQGTFHNIGWIRTAILLGPTNEFINVSMQLTMNSDSEIRKYLITIISV